MIDWFIIITPVAALAAVLLFGFVGCKFEAPIGGGGGGLPDVMGDIGEGVLEVPPDTPPMLTLLTLRARVPQDLTVVDWQIEFTDPLGNTGTIIALPPAEACGADNCYDADLFMPVVGTWNVFLNLRVDAGTGPDGDSDTVMFNLDTSMTAQQVATFVASGSPANVPNDYSVNFVGLSPA